MRVRPATWSAFTPDDASNIACRERERERERESSRTDLHDDDLVDVTSSSALDVVEITLRAEYERRRSRRCSALTPDDAALSASRLIPPQFFAD